MEPRVTTRNIALIAANFICLNYAVGRDAHVAPDSAEAECEIGEVYRKHDQPQAAMAAFQKPLAHGPNAVPARIGLAKALQQLVEKRQTWRLCSPAEQTSPSDPAVRFLLAQIYRSFVKAIEAGREEAAFESRQKVLPSKYPRQNRGELPLD